MIDAFTSTPFFGLALSVLCWCFAGWLQKKTRLLVCNPVLVTALLVIAVLLIFDIPLAKSTFSPWCWAALQEALRASCSCCCCAGSSRQTPFSPPL